ncbi:hypothetical protein [Mesorhizobium sp.]|uniref:hypothetical protein n=1 Tax=Mesorhizobium sp. TaxID=1871066 RepID=UPI000FE539D5|nr:hypothetical protein [Mesorhizobium sp.]RWP28330.1 MAG: hypothetical protein EOR02_19715 [Mesorhizobium sp.]
MRYLLVASLVVAIVLTLRWEWLEPHHFEDDVMRAALAEEVRRDDTRCPLSSKAVEQARPWVLAACAAGGLGWHEAAAKYGDDAARVFLVYGEDADFVEVFDRLGHPVVPVIAYFVKNGSSQYLLQETVGQGLSSLWDNRQMRFGLAEISPEQYGLIAVHELKDRGHEMLSEFEIVDGTAVRRQFTRTLLGAKNIVLGGVSDLEGVIARGERLPTWGEMGWAAFDAAIVVGGMGAAAKALRVARAPVAAAGRGTVRIAHLRAAGKGAFQSLSAVGTAAGVAAVVALPYLAITRPHLLTNAAGWIAEQAGLPAWLGAFAAYLILCLVLASLLRMVLAPLAWTLRTLSKIVGRLAGAGGVRSAAA